MLHALHSSLLVVYDDGQLLLNSDPKFQTEDHTLIGPTIGFIHIVDGHRVDVCVVGADISGQRPPRFTPVLRYDHPVDLDNGIHVNCALEVDVVAYRRTARASKLSYAAEVCNGRGQTDHT